MVAFKSMFALAAYLCASSALANPVLQVFAESDEAIGHSIRAINPFSGVSYTPYSGSGCTGKDQGNTNVNRGTTACANVSNAKSTRITADTCDKAYLTFYADLNCRGKVTGTTTHEAGCWEKTGSHKSVRIDPRGC